LIYSAEIGSIILQIFIFWLFSTFFSKKKKKRKNEKIGQLQTLIKEFVNKISDKIENSINELDIISDEPIHFQTESVPKPNNSIEPIKLKVIKKEKINKTQLRPKSQRRNRLGLYSKSTLKNAIILNEIIGKPVSLRK
jgi:hypothetical protein